MQFIPISAVVFVPQFNNIYRIFKQYKHYMSEQFKYHDKTYEEGVVRHFTDALIEARNEAVRDKKESAPYLTKYVSIMVI